MKFHVWKDRESDMWCVGLTRDNKAEVTKARTLKLAMAQVRWLMQHMRSE